jgi:hypothetical protein
MLEKTTNYQLTAMLTKFCMYRCMYRRQQLKASPPIKYEADLTLIPLRLFFMLGLITVHEQRYWIRTKHDF